jgi:hypothetical protein
MSDIALQWKFNAVVKNRGVPTTREASGALTNDRSIGHLQKVSYTVVKSEGVGCSSPDEGTLAMNHDCNMQFRAST